MTRTIRMTSESPVTPEMIEQLKRLAELPDSEIDTSDIPVMSFKGRKRKENPETQNTLKKAS